MKLPLESRDGVWARSTLASPMAGSSLLVNTLYVLLPEKRQARGAGCWATDALFLTWQEAVLPPQSSCSCGRFTRSQLLLCKQRVM